MNLLLTTALALVLSPGGLTAEVIPSDFGWNPSFNIYQTAPTTFTCDYNHLADKPSGTTVWVDKATGSDSNDGSEANPFETVAAAVTSGADVVNIKTGDYWRNHAWGDQLDPTKSMAFIAIDGPGTVRMGRIEDFADLPTWTSAGSGVYSTTRSAVRAVLDTTDTPYPGETQLDGTSPVHEPLTEVADLAAAQASGGSTWAQVGSTLYVKTHDSRQPDINVLPILQERNTKIVNRDIVFYLEGIEVWGDRPVYFDMGISNSARMVGYKCGMRYSGENDNVYFDGVLNTRLVECEVSHNLADDDGINYDRRSGNVTNTYGLEYKCRYFANGASTNDNGSTTHHVGTHLIRVMCEGFDQPGPAIADSSGAKALNYGCTGNDSYIGIQVGTASAGVPAMQWNKGCDATGNSNLNRDRSSGGIQLDLGDNGSNMTSIDTARNYIDAVTHPSIADIVTKDPDNIGFFISMHDTQGYADVSSEVNDFFDYSFNKRNFQELSNRGDIVSDAGGGLPGMQIVNETDDVEYKAAADVTYEVLLFVMQFGTGSNTTFNDSQLLIAGTESGNQPYVGFGSGTGDISALGDFATTCSVNGAAASATVLPGPRGVYVFEQKDGTAETDRLILFGNPSRTDRSCEGVYQAVLGLKSNPGASVIAEYVALLQSAYGLS